MSKIFGNKEYFALEYNLPYFNLGYDISSIIGILKLWVNGIDLCLFEKDNKNYGYEWTIYYIVEWLCEKQQYILGYDPFPLPVKGDNVLELIYNANTYNNDDKCEFDLWYFAKSRWIFNHCWFSSRDGGIIPSVYFRRNSKIIEISWDNIFWEEYGINFCSKKGVYYLPYFEFRKVIHEFLNSIITDLEGMVQTEKLANLKNKLLF